MYTHKEALAEKKRRKLPHKVLKKVKHDPLCLVSDGLLTPAHECTCGSKEHTYYLQLGK